MSITINGTQYDVEDVRADDYLQVVETLSGRKFYVALDRDEAGVAATNYWRDMAENDPKEFICIVGEDTLLKWALGQLAGPGSVKARSLEEWLVNVVGNAPEETFGLYDGNELDVEDMSDELMDELGISPSELSGVVAYRRA
jgi:hypothetical protein